MFVPVDSSFHRRGPPTTLPMLVVIAATIWPTTAHCWSESSQRARIPSKPGRHRATFGQNRGKAGRILAEFGQIRTAFGNVRPSWENLDQFRPLGGEFEQLARCIQMLAESVFPASMEAVLKFKLHHHSVWVCGCEARGHLLWDCTITANHPFCRASLVASV